MKRAIGALACVILLLTAFSHAAINDPRSLSLTDVLVGGRYWTRYADSTPLRDVFALVCLLVTAAIAQASGLVTLKLGNLAKPLCVIAVALLLVRAAAGVYWRLQVPPYSDWADFSELEVPYMVGYCFVLAGLISFVVWGDPTTEQSRRVD